MDSTDSNLIKPVIDRTVRDLCRRPYPGHPRGCPNYGKRDTCPPREKMLGEILDLTKPVWAIWIEFDLEQQRKEMWSKHPNWSRRQAECCLYWQSHVLNELKHQVASFCTMMVLGTNEKLTALYCPEACGVNVTETMKAIGVELQWPPNDKVYKIAFVGTPIEK